MVTVDLPHPAGRLTTNDESLTLPGIPGSTLSAIWRALTATERHAFLPHLIGTTSAEWLSEILYDEGHAVSASTIRTYRRSLRQNGDAQ